MSQVTERFLLVLCFKLCLYVSDWCEHHDVFIIVKLPVFSCLCFIERVFISTLIGTSDRAPLLRAYALSLVKVIVCL